MKLILCIAIIVLLAAPVWSFDQRSGQSIRVAEGTTITDDLLASGNSVVVGGSVDGSAFVAGSTVTVTGPVTGALAAAGGNVTIEGRKAAVTAAGGTVDARGLTARNLVVAGGTINIDQDSNIARDVMAAGSNISVRGTIGRNLKASGSNIEIGATVNGSVNATGQRIRLLPGALIRGNFIYRSPAEADIAEGATVQGRIIREEIEKQAPKGFAGRLITTIIGFLMMFLFGVVLIALFPRWMPSVGRRVLESPGWSALWGFVALIVVPIAAVVAMITVIGLPLGVALLLVYIVAMLVAVVISAIALGTLILRRQTIWLQFLVGLAILHIVGLIPVLGGIVWFAALIFGLGAIILSIFRSGAVPAPEPAG